MKSSEAGTGEKLPAEMQRLIDDENIARWKPFHDWMEQYFAKRGYASLTMLDMKACWQAASEITPSPPEEILGVYKREVERLRDKLNNEYRAAIGEVWHWGGDGEDHLESLICPILIMPHQLQELLNASQAEKERWARQIAEVTPGRPIEGWMDRVLAILNSPETK